MKKNFVRIVAALLVAMLALTLLPLGAFAIEAGVLEQGYYDKKNPTYADSYKDVPGTAPEDVLPETTIKAKDFKPLIDINGDLYDFKGFANSEKLYKKIEKWKEQHPDATDVEILAAAEKIFKDTKVSFDLSNIKIPEYPTDDAEKQQEWDLKYGYILAGYVPHQHKLSCWYSDGTTHWRECLSCKKHLGIFNQFMYQNWCTDGDEDGICNVCGGDVPYHDVTVIEEEGGKITVNRDNACHRMKITADVEPAEGYKLKKLHFTKIRDDGSEQEITRYKKNGQFWTYMPTYELEVSAEFVKVKTKK